jgi:hypothetical protein
MFGKIIYILAKCNKLKADAPVFLSNCKQRWQVLAKRVKEGNFSNQNESKNDCFAFKMP